MDKFERKMNRQTALKAAEKDGIVADSTSARKALMEKVFSGECTLEEVQKELKLIKRNAKKNGMITRTQAYNGG